MEDFYNDGVNVGSGNSWKNRNHSYPQTECDRVSYERGIERGERLREIDRDLDRDYFGY